MVSEERIKTNHMLMDELDMWDEFTVKAINDEWTLRYYTLLMNLLNNQVDEAVKWLDTEEAQEYYYDEAQYQYQLFKALEDQWDEILENKYPSVEALLQEVYNRGKAKGYADMREHIRYTDTDKFALEFVRDYNFGLIESLDDDVREQIKNTITSSIISGENPRSVAPKILETVGTRLEGSTFTPTQRAVMIARTEISRVQNTGILQSYINEGYTEVKILTAEDNNVCYTCLSYAYEFNEDTRVIFENRGEEKIHNIINLIENGRYPPFHPNCRCTYLSIWKTKGEPPEVPYIINLTPMKFLDSGNKIVLPDGKPKIKWTEESLREELSEFTDSQKELDCLVKGIMDYMIKIENRNIEYLNAIDNKHQVVCDQFTIDESAEVKLCPKGIKASKNQGLLFVIHNHPTNNPLQSEGDIRGFAKYNIKYNISFTEEEGLFILKNNGSTSENIIKGWNDIYQAMYEDFKTSNSGDYWHIIDLIEHASLGNDEYDALIYKGVIEHMSNNRKFSEEVYIEKMTKQNIGVKHINP